MNKLGVFGPRVLGQQEFERQQKIKKKAANIYGPRVTGPITTSPRDGQPLGQGLGPGRRAHQLRGRRLEPCQAVHLGCAFHKISVQHLDRYLDELEWRFNNRDNPFMSRDLLTRMADHRPLWYRFLTA